MTQDNEKKPRALGLSPAQVVGSALAAMSVAFFASWAGTTGTLIGAAFGSVIATVGAATYTWSLQRTSEAAKRTAALVKQRTVVTGIMPRTVAQGPPRAGEAEGPPPVTDEPPPVESPADQAGESDADADEKSRWWDLPWAKLAIASLAVMIAGMAGITAVEVVTGKPIASLLGRDDGTGTTLGHATGSDSGSSKNNHTPKKQTPAPQQPGQSTQPSQTPHPSEAPLPSTGPSQSPVVPPVQSQPPAPSSSP
jgi:hypothetical protein